MSGILATLSRNIIPIAGVAGAMIPTAMTIIDGRLLRRDDRKERAMAGPARFIQRNDHHHQDPCRV
ncbi:hypothetical protein HOY82DRAFT_614384 [Tuber indicum]|nr:hypothetical protein HOY82DRAFT_614384 [Tuber indicum]